MSCVTACPIYFYYNVTILKCLPCHSSCAYCTGPDITECTDCKLSGDYIQVNSSLCEPGCANRSYIDPANTTHCQPCDATCDNCIGATDHHCDSCFDLKVLDYDLSCQDYCSPNYFADPARRCVQCTYSCRNCTTNGFYNCTECFDDRYLREDSACILNCLQGFYYNESSDSCQMCHTTCLNCTGPNPTQCTECGFGGFVQPDGSCLFSCPTGTFKEPVTYTCQPCHESCETCTGGAANECILCKDGYFMGANKTCNTDCGPKFFEESTNRKCVECHPSCISCLGTEQNQCTGCLNPEVSILTVDGRCLNCFDDADKYPIECLFSVHLLLGEAPSFVVDEFSSASLQITYKNIETTLDRVSLLNLKQIFNLTVESFEEKDYEWNVIIRKRKLIIDLNFTIETKTKVKVTLSPIKKVILQNSISNSTELIFINKSASYMVQPTTPPNPSVVASIKSMASGAESSAEGFSYVTAALCTSVMAFPQLVSPLMKLFRVFKMLSRFRLINIYFGSYLEIFLSVCNLLFSLGGDEITKEALEAAPDTRGKLKEYKVTPLSVQPLVVKLTLFCLITAIRVYRGKIRRYAVKVSTLTWSDWLLNKIAESMRVTAIATLSLDIFFYSIHSVVHIHVASAGLGEAARHSLWLSMFAIVIITFDSIFLLIENRDCHFSMLRQQYRLQRKVNQNATSIDEKPLGSIVSSRKRSF
jgi:hypothetical protein